MPRPTTSAAICAHSPSAALPPPRWRGGCRRSGSSIASSMRRDSAVTIPRRSSKGRSAAARCRRCSTIEDVDRLLAAAQAGAPRAHRGGAAARGAAQCLLELVYATGLRVSELVALPASAAERNARMLMVRGKGGKERLVPLNDAAKRAMTEYRALLEMAQAASRPPTAKPSPQSRRRSNRNGCFLPSATPAISPASISRAN